MLAAGAAVTARRTSVIVAHWLWPRADRIAVVDAGRIVEFRHPRAVARRGWNVPAALAVGQPIRYEKPVTCERRVCFI